MRRLVFVFSLIALTLAANAQLQSPDQFLGYKPGTHFTPHFRIVEYFRYVAANLPSQVKIEDYGKTNEGRPLLVAYVSNAANISNLAQIRMNNLSLASMGGSANVTNPPAIVWLSYNVHGNEASSSEASMQTLYALADPSNNKTKQWLQNTVVVIDPCLNPDGRERYVNWYNSVVGKNFDPSLSAREHNEPWPGGRVNHYYFDLNRDWAWQTQKETQERLKLYNNWLPQIHVDFHEQGINQPYYFAPAAEPFHEVITPWQRKFQETIGRNHARYFDAAGWLYFTREIFDLFYPSYGDTYPLYNGAIGMTYEQAGGPGGGLGALTDDGDTLTLTDRVVHHFTTSLSTIEVASQNASQLVNEFRNYYTTAVTNGYGNYKSYVIKYSPQSAERIHSLLDLLEKNKIAYGSAGNKNARGYNYDSRREENFKINENDIVVPAVQPKSALVKVLFEPNPKLSDSATYDITAWALPYVYGLPTYATTEKFNIATTILKYDSVKNSPVDPYGYVIRWNGIQPVKLVSQLLQKGIKIRYSEKPFETGGVDFERGSIIILKTSNQYRANLWNEVRMLADKYNVTLTPVSTGFVEKGFDFGSAFVHPMRTLRIGLFAGEGTSPGGVGEVWHYFDQLIDYPVTLINTDDLSSLEWNKFDVLIMPNGSYRFLNDKSSADQLESWITKGGKLIALESAVAQLSKFDWGLKQRKTEDTSEAGDVYAPLHRYENRDRDELPNVTPGSIYKVELDNSHPLAFGYPGYYYTLKQDDRMYDFIKNEGWNVGILRRDKQVAGYVGSRLSTRIKDGVVFGVNDIGNGHAIFLADDVLFRDFWENGKLLFANAVFLVGQ
jgi:hypothetical protein